MTRREIFPRMPQIPYNVRFAIATICKRVYHEPRVDRLFIDNGCLLTWWIPPLKPLKSARMIRAMGWFDGIVLYAPERELVIAHAVCEEILRKPRLAPKIREELTLILGQLVPVSTLPAMPASIDEAIIHDQHLLEVSQRRLRYLELQKATRGQNTSPEILMEIEDLQESLRDLEQRLADAPGRVDDVTH